MTQQPDQSRSRRAASLRMGIGVFFAWCFLFLASLPIQAQEAASQVFLEGYLQRTEGEKAEKAGDFKLAYDCYRQAARIYDQVARDFPEYNPAMVAFRRKDLGDKITEVAERAAKMDLGRTANDPRPLPPGNVRGGAGNPGAAGMPPGNRPALAPPGRPPGGPNVVVRPPAAGAIGADDPFARLRIQELERQQSGARQAMESLAKERDALKTRLVEVENSRNLSAFESKKYREERDNARRQVAELQEKGINSSVADKARIAALEKQADEADKKSNALREKANTAAEADRARIATLEKQLAEADQNLKTARQSSGTASEANNARIATLEKQVAEANQNLKSFQEQAQKETEVKLAEMASGLKAEREQLAEKLTAVEAELAATRRDARQFEETVRILTAERDRWKAERDQLALQLESKGGDPKMVETNQRLERDLAAARAELARVTTARAEDASRVQELQEHLRKSEAKLAAALKQSEDERMLSKAERQRLARELEAKGKDPEMVKNNERLEKELAEARAEMARLTAARAEDDNRISELRVRLREVEGELTAARKENAAYRDQMSSLEKRLAEAKAQLEATPLPADNPVLAEENKTLKTIVIRQLRQQVYRARARNLLLSELAKLEINSKALLQYIDQLEGKGSMPSPEEVTGIDDHEIRALAGVELTGKFFPSETNDPALPTAGGEEAPASPVASTTQPAGPGDPPLAAGDPVASAGATPVSASSVPTGPAPVELTNRPDAAGAFDFQKRSLATTAEASFLRGDFKQAEDTYRLIVEADPADARMQCNLGVALLKQERFGDAIGRFQDALGQNESNPFAHLMLGVCHWKLREPELAVDRLNRSLVLDPSNAQGWLYLGLVAIDGSQWRDAETAFKKALELKPDYSLAHYNLAVIYTKPGFADPVQAKRSYDESLRLGGARDEAVELFLRVGAISAEPVNYQIDPTGLPVLDDTVPPPPPGVESVSGTDDLPLP